jgi:dipeptidyl aminopeptidase/acylaminoacyl peptidase
MEMMTGTLWSKIGKKVGRLPLNRHSLSTFVQEQYVAIAVIVGLANCMTGYAATNQNADPQRPFTVADDIGMARFFDPLTGSPSIVVSPDGHRVAVRAERGVLERNCLEDELRVYDMDALREFVVHPEQKEAPKPIWSLRESTYKEGVLISTIRWVRNSSGLAFLLEDNQGRHQLILASLKQSQPQILSVKGQDVTAFDVRNAAHYAYTIHSSPALTRPAEEQSMPAVDETGRSFADLVSPSYQAAWDDRSDLWASDGGPPHPVIPSGTTEPIVIYDEGQKALALSPDGKTLATSLPVVDVPKEWETLYPSPYKDDPYRIQARHQSVEAGVGALFVSQYVTIDLKTGQTHPVTAAPTGRSGRWVAGGLAALQWSPDGRSLALPSTFVASDHSSEEGNTPCLAIADLVKGSVLCLEPIKATYTKDGVPTPGYFFIDSLDFTGPTLSMQYRRYDQMKRVRVFAEAVAGNWEQQSDIENDDAQDVFLSVSIRESLNQPPVLVAKDIRTQSSRVIWDPNPQLRSIGLPEATVYHWKDESGHEWTGGLYKPADYHLGHRYPLVIQTHGFTETMFLPSGTMTTAFAARALAGAGIVVLQIRGCPIHVSVASEEAPCNVRGYEAAVKQLNEEGIIDPEKVGIIGFSRTVYYVMGALTASSLSFKAASITDGVDFGYWQYLLAVDMADNGTGRGSEAIYKAKPFGDGLQQWIKSSSMFKMQQVNAPLMVVGEGVTSAMLMWEPYAALRYLHKPTDLVLLNTNEHILTNPAVRLASQGGSVDWFRFWLQGYEDPALAKAEQYRRWRGLCDMQKADNPNQPTFCVNSKQ